MILRDLIEDQTDADIATVLNSPKLKYKPLQPGGKRQLMLRLQELRDKYDEVNAYHVHLRSFMMGKMPPGLEEDLIALEKEYSDAIAAELQNIKNAVASSKINKFLKASPLNVQMP